jgi:MFS family permease
MPMTTSSTASGSQRLSPWAPLRHRVFLALFVAQLASNIGTLMQNVGSAWLMGDLHASPALVALVQTATFLPVLIVGIPAGALADIMDRRRLLLGTQSWMMVCAGLLAVLTFAGQVDELSLLGLTFALGLGTAINSPAWQAIQPELVPRREFGQAVALGSLTYNVGRAVGPALGGLLVAAAGPGWVFAVNAASFVGTVMVLRSWRPAPAEARLPVESLSGATRGALRYGAHAPILRGVLARTGLFIFPAAAVQALLPIVVRGPLKLGSGGYGALLGCFGLGAVAAAIFRPRVEERLSPDQQVMAATFVLAATLLVEGSIRSPWPVAVALACGGGAWTTATIAANVAAQSALPSWVRARGMGLYMLVLAGGIALGSAFWGVLANWDLRGAFVVAAACLGASLLAGRRWRLAHTVGLDLTAVPGQDPVVTLMPRPTDGPVLVTLTYRVPDSEMTGFVATMVTVERHRRRTGAYQWGLFRDLAAPDRFVETFLVASWAEHLRQHQRHTANESHLTHVRTYMLPEMTAAHFISAYSTGALEPLEPHAEPIESLSDNDTI